MITHITLGFGKLGSFSELLHVQVVPKSKHLGTSVAALLHAGCPSLQQPLSMRTNVRCNFWETEDLSESPVQNQ